MSPQTLRTRAKLIGHQPRATAIFATAFFLALLFPQLSHALGSTAESTASGSSQASAHFEQWKDQIREIDQLLAEGKLKPAYKRASSVLVRADDARLPDDQLRQVLGMGLMVKACAAHGLGKQDEAIWLWQSAQVVVPGLVNLDLSAYGEAGVFLTRYPNTKETALTWDGQEVGLIEGDVTKPEKIRSPPPQFPGGSSRSRKTRLIVTTIIDTDGTLRNPQLVENQGSLQHLVSLLEAVGKWKFEPARLNGKPVPVQFNLTMMF